MAGPMTPRNRLLLLVCLAVVLYIVRAQFFDGPAPTATASASASRVAARQVPVPSSEVCTVPTAMPQRAQGALDEKFSSPFEVPPPPVVKVAVRPAPIVVAASAPSEPPPPTIPYKFMGHYDVPNEAPMVFLGMSGTMLVAKVGDTLEGGFRLTGIGPRELTFLYLQRNLPVRLPIEPDPS